MTFLVWKRGPRGPVASIDTIDPRSMNDAKLIEQVLIAVTPLDPPYDTFALASLIACFPCPAYEV